MYDRNELLEPTTHSKAKTVDKSRIRVCGKVSLDHTLLLDCLPPANTTSPKTLNML
jgi:hypothetical protein